MAKCPQEEVLWHVFPMQTSLAEKAARKVEKSSARLPYACFVKQNETIFGAAKHVR